MTVALAGIAEAGEPAAFETFWWFTPFGFEDAPTAREKFLPMALENPVPAVGCAANLTMIPYALPPNEPDADLYTWPGPRGGLAMLARSQAGQKVVTAVWPFVTVGEELEMSVDRVWLSPDRLRAVIAATIADALPVTWYDPLFAVNRGFYAQGSVHKVLLCGFAHRFTLGVHSSTLVSPGAPTFERLRKLNPDAIDDRGATTTSPGAIGIFPLEGRLTTLYWVRGPVKRIRDYGGELLGQKAWDVRVTVARIGGRDIDLSIMLTDYALDGRSLPQAGDDIASTVRLQGRIWSPNVRRA